MVELYLQCRVSAAFQTGCGHCRETNHFKLFPVSVETRTFECELFCMFNDNVFNMNHTLILFCLLQELHTSSHNALEDVNIESVFVHSVLN